MSKSDRPYDYLYRHHGLTWLFAELAGRPKTLALSHQKTVEAVARLDANVASNTAQSGGDPQERLLELRDVLEVKSEVLGFWGGIFGNSMILLAAGVAFIAAILAKDYSPHVAFVAFIFASLGSLMKVVIERRRTWVNLQLLAVKRQTSRMTLATSPKSPSVRL